MSEKKQLTLEEKERLMEALQMIAIATDMIEKIIPEQQIIGSESQRIYDLRNGLAHKYIMERH